MHNVSRPKSEFFTSTAVFGAASGSIPKSWLVPLIDSRTPTGQWKPLRVRPDAPDAPLLFCVWGSDLKALEQPLEVFSINHTGLPLLRKVCQHKLPHFLGIFGRSGVEVALSF